MARKSTLTDRKIRDLEPQDKEYRVTLDELPLSITVSPKGTKTYKVKYRIYWPEGTQQHAKYKRGQQVFPKIGRIEDFTLEEAKERARVMIAAGKKGIDQVEVWEREQSDAVRQAMK